MIFTQQVLIMIRESRTLSFFAKEHFSDNLDEAISFINQFVVFLDNNDYKQFADKYSILQNQKGIFKKSSKLPTVFHYLKTRRPIFTH